MIQLVNPVNLYGRKVIVDLVSRTGAHTMDSYSYGNGLAGAATNYLKVEELEVPLPFLFNNQVDFNADIVQPRYMDNDDYIDPKEDPDYDIVDKYNPSVDKVNFDGYYRRLEDIAEKYFEKYISNLAFSITHYTSNGLRDFNKEHRVQATLQNGSGDDDDDFTELADLAVAEDVSWPPSVINAAEENLPYVIKRLNTLSKYTKIHILSFIQAYLKAERNWEGIVASGNKRSFKRNDVIAQGVYKYIDGRVGPRIEVKNKNQHAYAVFDWIQGNSDLYASYFEDYLNLVHYCKVLNIDLLNDTNITTYDDAFCKKLVVTTVTTNEQYDKQIYDAIRLNSISAPMPDTTQEPSIYDMLSNTSNNFDQLLCTASNPITKVVDQTSTETLENYHYIAFEMFYTYMCLYENTVVDATDITWDDGYMKYKNHIVVLPASYFTKPDSSLVSDTSKMIISDTGHCLQLNLTDRVYTLHVVYAHKNFTNRVQGKLEDVDLYDWVVRDI